MDSADWKKIKIGSLVRVNVPMWHEVCRTKEKGGLQELYWIGELKSTYRDFAVVSFRYIERNKKEYETTIKIHRDLVFPFDPGRKK